MHFTKAFTVTTECSPSRASLLTSSYPTEHGVDTTRGGLDPLTDYSLEKHGYKDKNGDGTVVNNIGARPNLLRLLSCHPIQCIGDNVCNSQEKDNDSAKAQVTQTAQQQRRRLKGYKVAWKRKWHLTPPIRSRINPKNEDPSILLWYGATTLWNPPDAGHSLCRSSTLGGGWKFNHDGRFLRGENGVESLMI